MNNSKLGIKESIALILTIAIAHTIISTPRDLVSSMKSAVLINLVYITFILVLIVFIVIKLFKKFPGLDIIDISEYLGGKEFKKVLGIIFITFFIISSSYLLRDFTEALKIIYYPNTNIFFIIALFIISIAITSRLEFNAIMKANIIIVPIVFISCFFLFASNIKSFSLIRIFPLLGEGINNTFVVGLTNISSFAGISFIYFLPPLLKDPDKFKKISYTAVLLFFLYLFLNVAVILFMFSYLMSENEILPLYTASQYIQIGDFFVRFESIYLLIWIEVFACYLGITIKFCMQILKKITKIENSRIFSLPLSILIFGISMLPNTLAQIKLYEQKIYPFIVIIFSYIFCILLLLFANLKRNKENKVGVKNDTT